MKFFSDPGIPGSLGFVGHGFSSQVSQKYVKVGVGALTHVKKILVILTQVPYLEFWSTLNMQKSVVTWWSWALKKHRLWVLGVVCMTSAERGLHLPAPPETAISTAQPWFFMFFLFGLCLFWEKIESMETCRLFTPNFFKERNSLNLHESCQ